MALDYGPRGTDSLQALYRELTRPQFQPGICHLCGATMDVSYFHHYTLSHTPLSDPDQIIYSLSSATSDIFMYARHFILWQNHSVQRLSLSLKAKALLHHTLLNMMLRKEREVALI